MRFGKLTDKIQLIILEKKRRINVDNIDVMVSYATYLIEEVDTLMKLDDSLSLRSFYVASKATVKNIQTLMVTRKISGILGGNMLENIAEKIDEAGKITRKWN